MKMKQKLAASLAGVMALSMVPATSVFAANTTSSNRVVTVASSVEKMFYKTYGIEVLLETQTALKAGDVVTLTLEGQGSAFYAEKDGAVKDAAYARDGKVMQVKIDADDAKIAKAEGNSGKYLYRIPLDIKSTKKAGDINVRVDSNGAAIQETTVKVATLVSSALTVGGGGSTSMLEKNGKEYIDIKDITITESMAASIADITYKEKNEEGKEVTKSYTKWFTLTSNHPDFTWIDMENYDDEVAEDNESWIDLTSTHKSKVKGTLGFDGKVGNVKVYCGNGGYDLYIGVEFNGPSEAFGKLTLKDFYLYKAEDADYAGDVTVTMTSGRPNGFTTTATAAEKTYGSETDFTNSKVKLAVSDKDFTVCNDQEKVVNVTVKDDGNKTNLVAGRHTQNQTTTLSTAARITVKESVVGSITKDVEIEVPEGVKIVGYKLNKNDGFNQIVKVYHDKKELATFGEVVTELNDKGVLETKVNGVKEAKFVNANGTLTAQGKSLDDTKGAANRIVIDLQDFGYDLTESENDKDGNGKMDPDKRAIDKAMALEVDLYLSVSADFDGEEIYATVSTKYGDNEKFEEDFKVANVVKPVIVETYVTELAANAKKQEMADIVITENQAGALIGFKDIEITLEEGMKFVKVNDDVEVLEGNIKVKDVEIEGNKLTARVATPSTKASKIAFTGIYVTTKSMSDGMYDIRVGGSAISANDVYSATADTLYTLESVGKYVDKREELEAAMKSEDFVVDEDNADDLAEDSFYLFNAGSVVLSALAVGDVEVKKPVEKVETQEVTLKKGDLTYTRADGTKGTMLAAPYFNYDVNGGGITMVPLRAVGEILGATFEWSQETQTATFVMPDGTFGQVTNGSSVARAVDGSQYIMRWAVETPAGVDGTLFVPVRDAARILGFADGTVDYDYVNQCVKIQAPVVK